MPSIPRQIRQKQWRAIFSLAWFFVGIPTVFAVFLYVSWIIKGNSGPFYVWLIPFAFPLLGLVVLLYAQAIPMWRFNRKYLGQASLDPIGDDDFLIGCQPYADESFDPAFALRLRRTAEKALHLPTGVLRGDTDMASFGDWWLSLRDKKVREEYGVSQHEIEFARHRAQPFIGYVQAVQHVLTTRSLERKQTEQVLPVAGALDGEYPSRLVLPDARAYFQSVFYLLLMLSVFVVIVIPGFLFIDDKTMRKLILGVSGCVLGLPIVLLILYVLIGCRVYIFDRDARAVTFYVKCLRLIPIYRAQASFDEFTALLYRDTVTYVVPARRINDRTEQWEVVLVRNVGKEWVIGEDKSWTLTPCTKLDAMKISKMMGLPLQEINRQIEVPLT
jgi:hypothetical protein